MVNLFPLLSSWIKIITFPRFTNALPIRFTNALLKLDCRLEKLHLVGVEAYYISQCPSPQADFSHSQGKALYPCPHFVRQENVHSLRKKSVDIWISFWPRRRWKPQELIGQERSLLLRSRVAEKSKFVVSGGM